MDFLRTLGQRSESGVPKPSFVQAATEAGDRCSLEAGSRISIKEPNMSLLPVILALMGTALQDASAEELGRGFRSDNVETRELATQKLKELGTAAVPELERISNDPDPEVAGRAKNLLRLLRLRHALVAKLGADDAQIRRQAAQDLMELGQKDAVAEFIKLLDHPKAAARMDAASRLCRLGIPEGIPVLIKEALTKDAPGEFLWSLNRFLQSDVWDRLGEARTPSLDLLAGPVKETLEKLSRAGGLTLDVESIFSKDERKWLSLPWATFRIDALGSPREAIEDMLRTGPYGAVLEKERIRILSKKELENFWDDWWARRQKNTVPAGAREDKAPLPLRK